MMDQAEKSPFVSEGTVCGLALAHVAIHNDGKSIQQS